MNVNLALTAKGQILKAKIEAGGGTVPLNITRVVTGSGYSPDPLNLEDVVDFKQTFTIVGQTNDGIRAVISVFVTNQGNPATGEPPVAAEYSLTQIGFYALDPDEGEILYRITQTGNPMPVPPAHAKGWQYEPTFSIETHNASEVTIIVNPAGLATLQSVFDSVEVSANDTPSVGTALFARVVKEVPNYRPSWAALPPDPEFPD